MVITPHMIIGAAVGALSPSYWLAFVFSWLVHFGIDMIPHWDYLSKIDVRRFDHMAKIFADFILGCALVFLMARPSSRRWFVVFAAIVAILPDCLQVICLRYKSRIKICEIYVNFHHSIHSKKRLGFLSSLPILLIALTIAFVVVVDSWM